MDNFYSDERISSYLDGELSADEQARFEERLAENAELRQLVEELRALRGSLDLLPRYQLEPNFAERVLRRAEQQMLIGGEGGSGGGALAGAGELTAPSQADRDQSTRLAPASQGVLDESRHWRRRIVRPLIYAGAAIAAAILIMVFTPPRGNDVAEKPAQQGEAALPEARMRQNRVTDRGLAAAKGPAQEKPTFDLFANESNGAAKDGKPVRNNVVNESVDADRSKLVEGANKERVGRSPAPPDGSIAGVPAGVSNMPVGRDSLGQSGSAASKADQSGNLPWFDAAKPADKPNSGLGNHKLSVDGPPSTLQSAGGSAATGSLAGGGQSAQSRYYNNANEIAKATEILRRHGYGAAPANLLVASYEVSPNTSNSAFFELLAKHHIEMRPAAAAAPSVSKQLMDEVSREAGPRTEAFLEQGQPTPNDNSAANGRPSGTQQLGAVLAAAEPRRDLEIVYVDGSVQQITELVNDLDASKTEFHWSVADSKAMKELSLDRQTGIGAATTSDAMGDLDAGSKAAPANGPASGTLDSEKKMSKRDSGGVAAGRPPLDGTLGSRAEANKTVANGVVANGALSDGAVSNGAALEGTAAPAAANAAASGGAAAPGPAAKGPANAKAYSYRGDRLSAPAGANRAPRDEKNADSIAKSEAGRELNQLHEKQAGAKDAALQPGEKAQAADKSAATDFAPVAKGGDAETRSQPATAGFGAAKIASDDQKQGLPFYSQATKDTYGSNHKSDASDLATRRDRETSPTLRVQSRPMSERGDGEKKPGAAPVPSAPQTPPASSALDKQTSGPSTPPPTAAPLPNGLESAKSADARAVQPGDKPDGDGVRLGFRASQSPSMQADLGKEEKGEPYGYAFRLYPPPAEAKPELKKKEQLDQSKIQRQQFENAPSAGTATSLAVTPKSLPPMPSAPPSSPGAAQTTPPKPAESTQPSLSHSAPTYKAIIRSQDPSAPKSVKEPAPEGRGAERPAADQPAVEKPSQNREAAANLSAKTYDDESPAAAIPPNPPTAAPPDARRWPKQDTSLAGAQAGAMPDVRAGETAATSPRMRAILIFRVAPPTAAAAPPPVAGPAPVDKGK